MRRCNVILFGSILFAVCAGCDMRMFSPRWQSLSKKGVSYVPGNYGSASYLHGVTDEQFASGLRDLEKLKLWDLHLQHTELTDASIDGILRLKTLRQLNIGDNDFTAAGVARLAALPRLRQLYVPEGQLPAEQLEDLRAAMPNAAVTEWHIGAERYRPPADATTAPAPQVRAAPRSPMPPPA